MNQDENRNEKVIYDEIEYYSYDYSSDRDLDSKAYLSKVEVLLESLPYIKEYFDSIVVVKIGGSMMENDSILQSVLDDIVLMKYVGIKVVLVHGGGRKITKLMEEKGIKVEFVDGLRVTGKDAIDIVKMVLIGDINTKIVSLLNKHGEIAIGVSGNDANFIKCRKKYYEKDGRKVDLGFVGEIEAIDSDFITNILNNGYIPVVASLGADNSGNIYNVNADTCACDIASSLKARKLVLLTNVDGIFKEVEGRPKLISKLSSKKCMQLIDTGEISSGMIPKVKACINALKMGVERTHILNGTKEHSILVEIFTDRGIGTMILE
ncbi:MAG: acetylglutamate kinase [Actinobacteria bacterium]|nr:acetylglutamate kinase [Actinomycetota bacterium]